MVEKTNGDQRMVPVVDTTTMREILEQCPEVGVQDCQATSKQGVTVLETDSTVSEAGLSSNPASLTVRLNFSCLVGSLC